MVGPTLGLHGSIWKTGKSPSAKFFIISIRDWAGKLLFIYWGKKQQQMNSRFFLRLYTSRIQIHTSITLKDPHIWYLRQPPHTTACLSETRPHCGAYFWVVMHRISLLVIFCNTAINDEYNRGLILWVKRENNIIQWLLTSFPLPTCDPWKYHTSLMRKAVLPCLHLLFTISQIIILMC